MATRGWPQSLLLSFPFCCLTLAALTVTDGCSKKQAAPPPEPSAPAAPAKPQVAPPAVIGMEDPFARLTGDAAKSLKAGYKAMQAKKYDDARAAFVAVVRAAPDYSPARLQEVKAAALGGIAADVPALWKDLLARDFVGYAGRLDKLRELAPLRAAPAWAEIKATEASVRSAYAANLTKGLFFVARARDVRMAPPVGNLAKLELNQELYAFDLGSKRYRRLTETEGRVFAYSIAPERKMISFLIIGGVYDPTGPVPQFADPNVGAIDLATLETIGPVRLGGEGTHAAAVVLGWSAQGEPVWIVRGPNGAAGGEETGYALDATRTAAVSVPLTGIGPNNRTTATPWVISTSAPAADQASLSEDRRSLQIVDEDRTLRATRALDPDTIRFAPAGRRLAYAGAHDDCGPDVPGAKAPKNELYLWERGQKTAARIATAASAFRLDWPDDDRLVYQAGAGKQSRIHVLDVATKTDTVLKPRAGAALVGFAAVVCPGAAPEDDSGNYGDEDDGAE